MSIVLYVGGSKDGDKGVVPYGFSKSRTMTEAGPEVYVERMVPLKDVAGRTKFVPADHEWIQAARAVGTALGD